MLTRSMCVFGRRHWGGLSTAACSCSVKVMTYTHGWNATNCAWGRDGMDIASIGWSGVRKPHADKHRFFLLEPSPKRCLCDTRTRQQHSNTSASHAWERRGAMPSLGTQKERQRDKHKDGHDGTETLARAMHTCMSPQLWCMPVRLLRVLVSRCRWMCISKNEQFPLRASAEATCSGDENSTRQKPASVTSSHGNRVEHARQSWADTLPKHHPCALTHSIPTSASPHASSLYSRVVHVVGVQADADARDLQGDVICYPGLHLFGAVEGVCVQLQVPAELFRHHLREDGSLCAAIEVARLSSLVAF